jgi:hypothetical protein
LTSNQEICENKINNTNNYNNSNIIHISPFFGVLRPCNDFGLFAAKYCCIQLARSVAGYFTCMALLNVERTQILYSVLKPKRQPSFKIKPENVKHSSFPILIDFNPMHMT